MHLHQPDPSPSTLSAARLLQRFSLALIGVALAGCADSDLQIEAVARENPATVEAVTAAAATADADASTATDDVKPCCAGDPEETQPDATEWPSKSIYQLPTMA